jgi:hypothetical protein
MVVKCSQHLLDLMKSTQPQVLAKSGDGKTAPQIIGNVMIHPSAKVHPTAKVRSFRLKNLYLQFTPFYSAWS